MEYRELFEKALYEYLSGNLETKVINVLKDNGFDCNSTEEEVNDFIVSTSKTLKNRDIDEVVIKFFSDGNCNRHFLQKMFGKKRK